MRDQLKQALQVLYGNGTAGAVVCAADSAMQLQWMSDAEAQTLSEKLHAAGIHAPQQLPDGGFLVQGDGGRLFRCEAEPLIDDKETLYLLRFLPVDTRSSLNRAESVLLLREQASALHAAGTAILYAADRLNREKDEDGLPADPAAREPFLAIQDSCYALLRQSLCDQELLWYETAGEQTASCGVLELNRPLRRFFGQVELLTDRYLCAGVCDVQGRLYARADEARLTFALTAMLTEMWKDAQGQNCLDLCAARDDAAVRITLTMRRDAAQLREPLPVQGKLNRPVSAASAGMLLERFCNAFDARIMRRAADGTICCTMELPAAESLGNVLRSDCTLPDDSRLSLFHVLLSELLPAESLLESDPAVW